MHRYKNSFPAKLFRLIDDAERRGYGNILSWTEDGKAFTVHRIKEYCEAVMPLCFRRQSQFKSFTRQVSEK